MSQNTIVLTDDEPYLQDDDEELVDMVTYERDFNNYEWQSICLPFEPHYTDWEENFEMVCIDHISLTDKIIYAKAVKDRKLLTTDFGSMIRLKRSKALGRYKISTSNTYLYPQYYTPVMEFPIDERKGFEWGFNVFGQFNEWHVYLDYGYYYSLETNEETAGKVTPMFSEGYDEDYDSQYAIAKPYRWIANPAPSVVELMGQMGCEYFDIVCPDYPTDIEYITDNSPHVSDAIYNLSGLRVKSIERKGLYILNGKKILVK